MPDLRKYQLEAIEFSYDFKSSYLALDMGLGKTAIALNVIYKAIQNKKIKASLVLAPLRTIHSTWPKEIEKWRPELTYTILHGSEKDINILKPVNIYLINYEGLPWLFDELHRLFKSTGRLPFNMLTVDEASMLKSHRTKRFKIMRKLKDLAREYRLFLSGTPATNSYQDLWAQYYILDDGRRLGKSFVNFQREHFNQVDRMGYVWEMRNGADVVIQNQISDITYRLDAKDHLDLPARIDNDIVVTLPPKLRQDYIKLEDEFFLSLEGDKSVEVFNAPALSNKLRQFIQGAVYIGEGKERTFELVHNLKLEVLKELVETASGQGILCAIQFRFELEIISKVFPGVPVIAGGVNSKIATQHINDWNDGKIPLLLCHPASISHGVNLQEGSHLILWYGLPWSLEQYLQFNARLHRSGQKEVVVVNHILVEKTIDMKIKKALEKKFSSQKELLDFLKEDRVRRRI